MEKFESDHCPVCREPVRVNTDAQLTEEERKALADQIYVPGDEAKKDELSKDQSITRSEIEQLLQMNRGSDGR